MNITTRFIIVQNSVQYLSKCVLAAAIFVAASSQAATCVYSVTNEWTTGFQGSITVTNNGSTVINGWNLGWQYTANKITSSWNATLTGSNLYAATNLDWNKTIQPGQSVSFGVQGDKNGGVAEKPVITGSVCSTVTSSSIASTSKSSVASSAVTSSSLSSVMSSSSSVKSSSSISSIASGQQCNWYGTLYPLCSTTTSGWGYENNKSCIAASTCSAQPAPYGIVGAASSASSSSVISTSSSSLKTSSSVATTSSSVKSNSSSSVASSVVSTGLKSLVSFPIGVAVNAGTENNSILSGSTSAQQQAVVFPNFNQFTAGNIMKMSYLHPSESTFTFTQADDLISFANLHGIKMHAHTLIWHSDYQIPNFMKNYTGDFAAMMKTHVQTIASHFSGKVSSWDVVNEALAEDGDGAAINGFRNSIFYQKMGLNFIDQAFINARAADPIADLFYNDFNIENGGTKTTNLLAMVDGMKARGVPITGVGFQMHVLLDWPSTSTIEAAMKAVADRGLKVKISEFDVRVNNPYNSSATVYTSLTPTAAALQKERYRQIVASYVKVVPAAQRAGITIWGVWDADSWLNTASAPDWPLLFDTNFQAKPAWQGFADGLISAP
jgi:endo-1,4-beta-xylanase